MRKRYRLWMADWRDEHGHRRRKGFPTRKEALAYQEKTRALREIIESFRE